MDAHKNFAYSTIAVAPIPATSGTAITVAAGQGTLFPAVPFNATIWAAGANPLTTNAEIVRVTLISTDVLTIVRAQESSSARTIVVGDQIANTITKYTFEDLLNNPDLTTGFKIGGAAASRKIIVGDGTNFIPSTETWAVPSTAGKILTSDGTNWTSAVPIVTTQALTVYPLIGGAILAEPPAGNLALITTANALASQQIRYTVVYLSKGATITGVKWFQNVQGSYTASNYNGVGLYTISAGTMTLVASSTDDGNIWKAAANTFNSKAFSSTYVAVAGVYVVAALYCTSAQTTAPTIGCFAGMTSTALSSADFANTVMLYSAQNSQTAFPSPRAMSGLTITTQGMYFALY